MSASTYLRRPPTAPALLDLDFPEPLEDLVMAALFKDDVYGQREEQLRSTDEGMTGGVTLSKDDEAVQFLEGALVALEPLRSYGRAGETAEALAALLAHLEQVGPILVTRER